MRIVANRTGFYKIFMSTENIIQFTISYKAKTLAWRYCSIIQFLSHLPDLSNDFGNRWCKREYVEPNALKEWKVSISKIVDQSTIFYSQNTNLLPTKPKSTFRHLKQGIQDFHRKYVFVPANTAANNVVVV